MLLLENRDCLTHLTEVCILRIYCRQKVLALGLDLWPMPVLVDEYHPSIRVCFTPRIMLVLAGQSMRTQRRPVVKRQRLDNRLW